MSRRRSNVLAALARARPARLDANSELRANWPTAAQLIETAESADLAAGGDDPALDVHLGGPRAWPRGWSRRRPIVQVKLLGAITSAAVTAVVIVIAVVVAAVVLRAPHPQRTGPPTSSPSAGTPVFRSLSPGPHWHGHLAYAVSNGVVYLAGTATVDHQGSQSRLVATLPRSARPVGRIDVVAAVSGGAGAIEIGADGRIDVIRQQIAVTWVSLGGVSFPLGSR